MDSMNLFSPSSSSTFIISCPSFVEITVIDVSMNGCDTKKGIFSFGSIGRYANAMATLLTLSMSVFFMLYPIFLICTLTTSLI